MTDTDFDAFSSMLDDVAALLPPSSPLTPTGRAMFFRAVSMLSLQQVRGAFDAHVKDTQRGRFFPKPADLFAQTGDDRPGADEAWAIAVKGMDESASIVWTTETAEAWGIARPVMDIGDEVGARVAFRDAYQRLVARSKAAGVGVQWFASLGHDPAQRDAAILLEAKINRNPGAVLLEPPKRDPLLELAQKAPQNIRERLLAIRDTLTSPKAANEPSEDALAKQRTVLLQRESMHKVERYMRA